MSRFSFIGMVRSFVSVYWRRLLYLVWFACSFVPLPVHACPLCKEALSSIKLANPGDLVKGYNISIIIMIVVPFSLVFIVGAILWRVIKRNQRVL